MSSFCGLNFSFPGCFMPLHQITYLVITFAFFQNWHFGLQNDRALLTTAPTEGLSRTKLHLRSHELMCRAALGLPAQPGLQTALSWTVRRVDTLVATRPACPGAGSSHPAEKLKLGPCPDQVMVTKCRQPLNDPPALFLRFVIILCVGGWQGIYHRKQPPRHSGALFSRNC